MVQFSSWHDAESDQTHQDEKLDKDGGCNQSDNCRLVLVLVIGLGTT